MARFQFGLIRVTIIDMRDWFLYILRCSDNSLYTGISKEVEGRVKKHNLGKGASYTRSRLPVSLVYKENVGIYSEALKKEIKIKKLTKDEKENLIKKNPL